MAEFIPWDEAAFRINSALKYDKSVQKMAEVWRLLFGQQAKGVGTGDGRGLEIGGKLPVKKGEG